MSAGCTTVVDFDAAKDGCLGILTNGSTKKSFRFDRVYTPKDDQGKTKVIKNCLFGHRCCHTRYKIHIINTMEIF